jgi:hypothetical protein
MLLVVAAKCTHHELACLQKMEDLRHEDEMTAEDSEHVAATSLISLGARHVPGLRVGRGGHRQSAMPDAKRRR